MEDEKEKSDAYERQRESASARGSSVGEINRAKHLLIFWLSPSLRRLSLRFARVAKPGFLSSTQGEGFGPCAWNILILARLSETDLHFNSVFLRLLLLRCSL